MRLRDSCSVKSWPRTTTKTVVCTRRFELWVRQTCPYPYSDGSDTPVVHCEPGQLRRVLKSLVYSTSVDNLAPFTKYEFQLSVDNEAGSLPSPAITYATTLPAGIDYRLSVTDYWLLIFFVEHRWLLDNRWTFESFRVNSINFLYLSSITISEFDEICKEMFLSYSKGHSQNFRVISKLVSEIYAFTETHVGAILCHSSPTYDFSVTLDSCRPKVCSINDTQLKFPEICSSTPGTINRHFHDKWSQMLE